MKAVVVDRYGTPDVMRLAEVPAPVLGDRGILVRNHATVATPPDVAMRSGNPAMIRLFAGLLRPKQPVIGTVFAGEVAAVGRDVTAFRPGDRVYGATDVSLGCYAEYVAVADGDSVVAMPPGARYGDMAALSEGFLTALPFLRDGAKLQPGQSLLINGASGNVGAIAVQLARHMGAIVTAVCSGRNAELVRSLGADRVIDYTAEDFTAGGVAYDAIFDAVGKSSFARCRDSLKPGGIYLTTVPSLGIMLRKGKADRDGKRADILFTGLRPAAEKLKDMLLLNQLVASGKVRAVIDRTYPLEQIVAAHEYVETGRKRGSVVIAIAAEEQGRLAA